MPAELSTPTQQDSWVEMLEQYLTCERLRRGQIVSGTVVKVSSNDVIVDVGAKCEGVVPAEDLQKVSPEVLADIKVGTEVMVYVVAPGDGEGNTILSLARAQSVRDWQVVQRMIETQETIDCDVVGCNKGGVLVNINRLRGFVPGSQLAISYASDRSATSAEGEERWAALIGETLTLRVVEVDQSRNRLILSERAAIRDWRKSQRETVLQELSTGEVRQGKVINLSDFGAFVDIGGIDGLVHLSELSWKRVGHPSDVLQVGQVVDVYVLGVDQDRQRVALSIKRLLSDPWSSADERYKQGQLVEGTVTRMTKWGAFAQIVGDEAIEGLIHISELDDRRVTHPREVVEPNQVVALRVLNVDSARHRLALSLKQVSSGECLEQDWNSVLGDEEPVSTGAFSAALTEALDAPEDAELAKSES
ncbi:MAG: S1 RNA-binding domain-containing protein [Anaerolineae bacterium]|nr:S1 RNA-binding domain-containing protein [Anaerolineae bacterium]